MFLWQNAREVLCKGFQICVVLFFSFVKTFQLPTQSLQRRCRQASVSKKATNVKTEEREDERPMTSVLLLFNPKDAQPLCLHLHSDLLSLSSQHPPSTTVVSSIWSTGPNMVLISWLRHGNHRFIPRSGSRNCSYPIVWMSPGLRVC